MTAAHEVGGYRRPEVPAGAIRLDLNEAPREAAPAFRSRVLALLEAAEWRRYGDMDGWTAREAAAQLYRWTPAGTLVGNGSNELLAASLRALVGRGGRLAALAPSFSMVPVLAGRIGFQLETVPLRPPSFAVEGAELLAAARGADAVLLCSPNNPTGGEVPGTLVRAVLGLGKPVIWDAAYVEFSATDPGPLLAAHRNLVVLRTLSKAWGLAGVRAGACLGDARLVGRIAGEVLPFATGCAVTAAFRAAAELRSLEGGLVGQVVAERERLVGALTRLEGFEVVPSQANFFLLRRRGWSGSSLAAAFLSRGIAIRVIPELDAEGYVRVTVGSPEENDAVLRVAREAGND